MFACGRVVFLVVVTFLRTVQASTDAVPCVAMETCLLPCRFSPGGDLVVHWIQEKTKHNVHSFYHDRNQLGAQDPSFRGRTALFQDQIAGGNASLRLTGVTIQDQGLYKCYTGTNERTMEVFILLQVNAPVRRVDIQQAEDSITCSSEGIYPLPGLTWSTRPPSNRSLWSPTVQQTAQQLFSISSSVPNPAADLDYICTVSGGGTNRTATWARPTSISGSESGTTIPCASLPAPHTSLTWRFNHSHTILKQNGSSYKVSDGWTQHVEISPESTDLTLKDLSSAQEGIYTCELSNSEETYVANTFLRVQTSPGSGSNAAAGIAAGVVGAVGAVYASPCGLSLHLHQKQEKEKGKGKGTGTGNHGFARGERIHEQRKGGQSSGDAAGRRGRRNAGGK
uniref:Ig-like domain-containing protein n=1 Tax=Gasterosteus aculeatus aculeatus TaxID=481459 RepID=A0AAQ4NZE4_GASAC